MYENLFRGKIKQNFISLVVGLLYWLWAINNFHSRIHDYQRCIPGKINLLITIKRKLYSLKPFNVTFHARKEHLLDAEFTIWIYQILNFTLSGFNINLDCIIFIDLRLIPITLAGIKLFSQVYCLYNRLICHIFWQWPHNQNWSYIEIRNKSG